MISEELIKEWLEVINEVVIEPYWWINDQSAYKISKKLRVAREAVPTLIAEVRRLAKLSSEYFAQAEQYDAEADWLASGIECIRPTPDCAIIDGDEPIDTCLKCWRRQAREAVQDERTRISDTNACRASAEDKEN